MILNLIGLGQRIKMFRRKRGLTQIALSDMIDVNTSFLSKVESGQKGLRLETLVNLANALNVSTDELLSDSLQNTIMATNHLFAEQLADCTEYERRVLEQSLKAIKDSLRANRAFWRIHR